jgi:hypothetical protein
LQHIELLLVSRRLLWGLRVHFHLPKPLHGWREFAGEVGIIVLGVLIALGFEQVVEELNWHERTRAAVSDLKSESENNFALMAERVTVQPCVDAQLDQLMAHVLNAGQAAPGSVGSIETQTMGGVAFRQPVDRPFQDDVWRSLITDGTVGHFDQDGRQRMAQLYWQIESIRDLQKRGDEAVGELNVLLSPLQLDPTTRGSLATTIAKQKFLGKVLTLDSVQGMAMLRSVGQDPRPVFVNDFLKTSGTFDFCQQQHLPLADWRTLVANEIRSDRGFGGGRSSRYQTLSLLPHSRF